MMIETQALSGPSLNWALAILAGYDPVWLLRHPQFAPDYVSDWTEAGLLSTEEVQSEMRVLVQRKAGNHVDVPGEFLLH